MSTDFVGKSRPLTAGEFLVWLNWEQIHRPPRLPDFRLGDYYVRLLGFSPRGRHVHYEILRPRRRKNQAPDRRWMRTRNFLIEATVCGYFQRVDLGGLRWFEWKTHDQPPAAPGIGLDASAFSWSGS